MGYTNEDKELLNCLFKNMLDTGAEKGKSMTTTMNRPIIGNAYQLLMEYSIIIKKKKKRI